MSGEHGDGLARSVWNRKLFGPEVYAAFGEVKHAFDPTDRMNPGKVVAEPDPGEPADRPDLSRRRARGHRPRLLDAQGGFARAVGDVLGRRRLPQERRRDHVPELHGHPRREATPPEARANTLRLVMDGTLPADGLASEALDEALDLCLQCKACKTECPPTSTWQAQGRGTSTRSTRPGRSRSASTLMANIHRLNRIGSATAPLANATLRSPAFRWLLEKVAGIDRRRTLPTFARDDLRRWFRRHQPDPRAGSRGSVILMDDCFTTYNNPRVGRAAVRVLEASRVQRSSWPAWAAAAGRRSPRGCSTLGRDLARENVRRLVGAARAGTPILGCEPSCLLTLVDEYRDFRLGPDADLVAASARLVDAFIADRDAVPDLPLVPGPPQKVLLHGHCQQKALVGTAATVAALRRIEGLEVAELDSGCCGMAGSFGYELGHYEVSEALANRVLLPAVAREPGARLVAPGFSCRSQVHGLAGVDALHPIEVIAARLAPPP